MGVAPGRLPRPPPLLLSLLLLQVPGGHGSESICHSPQTWNWSNSFSHTCLNLTGLDLNLPLKGQMLNAPRLQVLHLSGTGLQELPPPAFFAHLQQLRVLWVTDNVLRRADGALAALCSLDLRADCSCVLNTWHEVRLDNCSGQQPPLQCRLRGIAGRWYNLSSFLEADCGPGLAPAAIGAVVAGGGLLLTLVVLGPLLAWRQWLRRSGHGNLNKAWTGAQDKPGPGSGQQPLYSPGLRAPVAVPPDSPSATEVPDYENMVLGQPPVAGAHPSEDSDFYMNYTWDGGSDAQPVYCNLQTLARASLDDNDYMVAGRH
ncbi:leucine-rich repeat-containing protein 25 [Ochotona princeps]|uniref:leucine-rich repeat-containing protein 25 n=1 Tax=Ochotona princeps TaxID=9978 RepID=UPI0027149E9A|nr:leucine-rich repeat-containing protein 25 [Ochotona princeps]